MRLFISIHLNAIYVQVQWIQECSGFHFQPWEFHTRTWMHNLFCDKIFQIPPKLTLKRNYRILAQFFILFHLLFHLRLPHRAHIQIRLSTTITLCVTAGWVRGFIVVTSWASYFRKVCPLFCSPCSQDIESEHSLESVEKLSCDNINACVVFLQKDYWLGLNSTFNKLSRRKSTKLIKFLFEDTSDFQRTRKH